MRPFLVIDFTWFPRRSDWPHHTVHTLLFADLISQSNQTGTARVKRRGHPSVCLLLIGLLDFAFKVSRRPVEPTVAGCSHFSLIYIKLICHWLHTTRLQLLDAKLLARALIRTNNLVTMLTYVILIPNGFVRIRVFHLDTTMTAPVTHELIVTPPLVLIIIITVCRKIH